MNRSANARGRGRWTNRRTWPRTKSSRWSHRFLDSTLGFMLYSITAVPPPCCVGVHVARFGHLPGCHRLLPVFTPSFFISRGEMGFVASAIASPCSDRPRAGCSMWTNGRLLKYEQR